jgi:hypothetical protein
MTVLTDARGSSAQSGVAGRSRSLIEWVSCNNPFYAISALLICLGLWVSFGGQAQAVQTWALMTGLTGYTLLLAVTACLLVRWLGVWDDVRTVMLLTVLMFLATSVTFDEVLAVAPMRGIACFLAGLTFAVAVSEGMLRGAGLKLPLAFRVPYYLILALFYLYPVALVPLLDQPRSEGLEWALFGFSPAAGLVALTLLPAVRRGRSYVRDNGSPWPWAWYPWTLFGVLGFGVVARSALLCWSMHHLAVGSVEPYIFGPYFLVPFLFCVALLLLEIGLVERKPAALHLALAFPVMLIIMAAAGHREEMVYQAFLSQFTARLGGTPLFLTLVASAAFYAYAWRRKVPCACGALTGVLLCMAFVGPATRNLDELTSPRPVPLLVVAGLQILLGLLGRSSWRCLLGAGCLIAAGLVAHAQGEPSPHRLPIAFHATLLTMLVLGSVFDDALGRGLRNLAAALAVLGCLAVMTGRAGTSSEALPPWLPWIYPPALCLVLAAYGRWLGHGPSLWAAGLTVCLWLIGSGWRGYCSLRHLVAGLDYIALGVASFALAWLTSLIKGGVVPLGTGATRGKGEAEGEMTC